MCASLQQRERAKKSPEKLAKLLNKTYDMYLDEREREEFFSFFVFVDQQTNENHESPHSVTRDFSRSGWFSWSSFCLTAGGISPEGKKKGKKKKNRAHKHEKRTRNQFLCTLTTRSFYSHVFVITNARTCRKRASHLFVKHTYARTRKRSSRARSRDRRRRRRERKGAKICFFFYGNMSDSLIGERSSSSLFVSNKQSRARFVPRSLHRFKPQLEAIRLVRTKIASMVCARKN